ncbi:MAG TPA: group II intron maturase-specific domain-containing protein [Clostridiaceae bacterium]
MKVTNKEIKYSKLQIDFEDSRQEDNAEHESSAGVYASLKITENNITNGFVVKDRLLEKIMDKENVRVALKRVISNKGSHGIDGMKVDELRAYLNDNWITLKESVMDGTFRPNPARRVEILKEDGIKEKTTVDLANKLKFLGFSFYNYKNGVRVRIHPKSIAKIKAKVKLLTGRSYGISNEERPIKLRRLIMGWINYFKIADIKSLLKTIDEWMRRRIQMIYWKQWKKVKTKFIKLTSLGIEKSKAWEFANTRKGYWRISNSPIVNRH